MSTRALLVALLVTALALAGCSGSDGGSKSSSTDTGAPEFPDDCDDGGLCAAPETLAPNWQVGQSWVHTWSFGGFAFPLKVIVAEATGDDFLLATDNANDAATARAFFFPDIGRMSNTTWTATDGDFQFPWYDFPLADGKTWTGTEENLDFDLMPVTRQLTFTANATGDDAYTIEAREAGSLRARYDYDPEVGWFSRFDSFDAGGNVTYSIESAAPAQHSGPYFVATGDLVLEERQEISPVTTQVQASPGSTFNVAADATHLLFILQVFAVAGAAQAQLVAPDGQHWEANVVGDADGNPAGGTPVVQQLVPAVVGQWAFATAGASGIHMRGDGFAWALTITEGQL